MKKLSKIMLGALAGSFLFANVASAIDLPTINLPTYMAFDLDNWTRLFFSEDTEYTNNAGDVVQVSAGDLVPNDEPNAIIPGIESRAFLTFNDIAPTIGPGGADLPATWVGGLIDNTYLHGWEDNVILQGGTIDIEPGPGVTNVQQGAIPQGDGSLNLYFTDDGNGSNWEFEIYQTTLSTLDFITDSNFIQGGPTTFDTIQTNLSNAAISDPFIRGNFAESLYFDATLAAAGIDLSGIGAGAGYILATAAINIATPGVIGGEWVNQILTPYGLGVNAFVDVDPTWGVGAMFQADFYAACDLLFGTGWCNVDPYDLAIQGVTLNSESANGQTYVGDDGQQWVVSDDEVRAGRAVGQIPEPATMLLLGTGLVGLAGSARRRKGKKQA